MVKQISDKEIYLLIKYIKSVLWRVAKRLSYIEEARCLKVNVGSNFKYSSECELEWWVVNVQIIRHWLCSLKFCGVKRNETIIVS